MVSDSHDDAPSGETTSRETHITVLVDKADATLLIGVLAHLESAVLLGAEWTPLQMLSRLRSDLVALGLVPEGSSNLEAGALLEMNQRLRRSIGESP